MSTAFNLSNRSETLARAMSKRPRSARIAVYLMVVNIAIFQAFSGYKYLAGALPLTQLNANLLVYSTLLILPWRTWLAGEYSRIAYTLLASTWISYSVIPLFLWGLPDGLAERLVMFLLAVPVELASLFFLCSPATTAWFAKVRDARAAA
ncbi:MAG: hypothetical protein K2P67_09030 [Gallionellaceae bacterium]|nr:hypothetical protein [Gallionellaceae bacterium]